MRSYYSKDSEKKEKFRLWGIKLNQTWVEHGVYKNCINDTLDYLQ